MCLFGFSLRELQDRANLIASFKIHFFDSLLNFIIEIVLIYVSSCINIAWYSKVQYGLVWYSMR